MPTTQADFRAQLEELVKRFNANKKDYLDKDYGEANVRSQLIDPLFAALGWDMDDQIRKLGPKLCEVVREKGDTPGRPDYNFRLNGQTRFFVEAKAPHVNLDKKQILQAIYYARNAQDVSFAVLTDFQEFRLYDASLKPDEKHPERSQIFAYSYDQYLTDKALADFWKLSRDQVEAGSLDQLLKKDPASRKRRIPLDEEFLADLTDWRELLAKSAYKQNPELDVAALNEAVQVFLDRLIFIRIAECRLVLPPGQLQRYLDQWTETRSFRALLKPLFQRINEELNGEVFKPNSLLDSEPAAVEFQDELIAKIIAALCEDTYNFAQIPVEMLGSIYERYLGKTIRVTPTRAMVEDKPEVRKAGGVYYTPKFIVDYIVKNTVGKMIEGKNPNQLKEFRVLDMACGSGSFLLCAYQYLLDYYLDWYKQRHPRKFPEAVIQEDQDFRLTTSEKKRILTRHIFGVDIDPQAVEITMMSLYIKALEGENPESIAKQMDMYHEPALPELSGNIKCGNSLINYDDFQKLNDSNKKDSKKLEIKWFNWNQQFPEAMKTGGFDCIIGNPPYGIIFDELIKIILEKCYSSFVRNNDIYVAFSHQAIEKLKPHGLFGFIIPNTFLIGPYFDNFKRFILENTKVLEIVDFGLNEVFPKPNVFTALLFFQKDGISGRNIKMQSLFARVTDLNNFPNSLNYHIFDLSTLKSLQWAPVKVLAKKLLGSAIQLDNIAFVKDVGLNYWTQGRGKKRGGSIADRVLYEGERKTPKDKPYLKGRDISRYSIKFGDHWLRHDWEKRLDPKVDIMRYSPEYLERKKVIYRQTADRIIATLEPDGLLTDKTLHTIVLKEEWKNKIDLQYLLVLLNSSLMTYLYQSLAQEEGRSFAQVKIFRIKQLPIKVLNLSKPTEKSIHDRLIESVKKMLKLNESLLSGQSTSDRQRYQSLIEATDQEIDKLVYELYNLNEEEIKVVEGKD